MKKLFVITIIDESFNKVKDEIIEEFNADAITNAILKNTKRPKKDEFRKYSIKLDGFFVNDELRLIQEIDIFWFAGRDNHSVGISKPFVLDGDNPIKLDYEDIEYTLDEALKESETR